DSVTYSLSLHDALPICRRFPLLRHQAGDALALAPPPAGIGGEGAVAGGDREEGEAVALARPGHLRAQVEGVEQHADLHALRGGRSEEHTSELQSRGHLV